MSPIGKWMHNTQTYIRPRMHTTDHATFFHNQLKLPASSIHTPVHTQHYVTTRTPLFCHFRSERLQEQKFDLKEEELRWEWITKISTHPPWLAFFFCFACCIEVVASVIKYEYALSSRNWIIYHNFAMTDYEWVLQAVLSVGQRSWRRVFASVCMYEWVSEWVSEWV